MNQILDFEQSGKSNKKRRKGMSGSTNTKKIIIFFAVALMIFGVALIGYSVYNMFYATSEDDVKNLSEATVTFTPNDETKKLDIKINNDRTIETIVYSWDNGESGQIKGNNRNSITESIDLPTETSVLTIEVTDIRKKVTKRVYTYEVKVDIELSQGDHGLNMSFISEQEISYITYQWNNGTEEKLEVNDKEYQTTIKVPNGENTLTLVVMDNDDNIIRKYQTGVTGAKKPTIEVSIDSSNFIIKATDDEEIEKVIIRANGEDTTIEVGAQEFEYKVPFIDGYNDVKILVYNSQGMTEYKNVTLTK